MRKNEFIEKLSFRLANIDSKERNNILNYYDELLTDKIDSGINESVAVNDLGTIDEIVRKLNLPTDELKTEPYERIKYDSVIGEKQEMHYEEKASEVKDKKNTNWTVIIILLILATPLWIAAASTIFGLLVGAFAMIFAFTIAGIAISVSGLAVILCGVLSTSVVMAGGIVTIGIGMIIFGIGIILSPIMVKTGSTAIHGLVAVIKRICGSIKGGKKNEN